MDRKDLFGHLERLRELILAERRAAKSLSVDEMLELTARKESLLRKILPLVDSVRELSPPEREMAEAVYTENLRNAYFFWSALKWVRESVGFIGEQISCQSYEKSGAVTRRPYSGALLSGRV